MARTGTYAISQSTDEYEIDVFLVAYSFTPEQTVYSPARPMGGYLAAGGRQVIYNMLTISVQPLLIGFFVGVVAYFVFPKGRSQIFLVELGLSVLGAFLEPCSRS